MKITLMCKECGHQEWGATKQRFMNRLKMWNHIRHAHLYLDPKPTEMDFFTEEVLPQETRKFEALGQLSY